MELTVAIKKKKENYYILSPAGSIDSDTYQILEKKLGEALSRQAKAVMLDMAGVAYVSSIGITVIFKAKQALEERGGKLVLARLQPNIKKVFDALKAIPGSIFMTTEEAEASLLTVLGDGLRKKN